MFLLTLVNVIYKNGKVTHVNISVYICIEACWVPGRKLLLPKDVIFHLFKEK